MLMLPATGAVFLLAFLAVVRPPSPPGIGSLLMVWAIVYAFVAIYWVSLWWSMVRWTRSRLGRTAAVTILSGVIGCAVGALCLALARRLPLQLPILIGGGTVPIAWVLGSVIVWRETPSERAERLAAYGATVICPLCGYNMAGLRQSCCPECGGSFTLDQLAAAQPRAAGGRASEEISD